MRDDRAEARCDSMCGRSSGTPSDRRDLLSEAGRHSHRERLGACSLQ